MLGADAMRAYAHGYGALQASCDFFHRSLLTMAVAVTIDGAEPARAQIQSIAARTTPRPARSLHLFRTAIPLIRFEAQQHKLGPIWFVEKQAQPNNYKHASERRIGKQIQ